MTNKMEMRSCTIHSICKFNIHDIVEVRHDEEWYTLYTNKGRIASVSYESIGISNLLSRCKKEGIPINEAEQRYLSKWVLYVHCMHNAFIIAIILLVLFLIVGISAWQPGEMLSYFLLFFGIVVVTVIIFSCFLLNGFRLIHAQEKALHFSFNQEMKRLNIHGKMHIDHTWYIVTDRESLNIIALHREFIKNISAPKIYRESYGDKSYKMIITAMDGKNYKLVGLKNTLQNVKKWWLENKVTNTI